MLREIFGPKRDDVTGKWRRLHNEKHHDAYYLSNIILKYTLYVVTVKHNYLLCLYSKVHTWRPVSIKHDHRQTVFIFIQRLKQYMD